MTNPHVKSRHNIQVNGSDRVFLPRWMLCAFVLTAFAGINSLSAHADVIVLSNNHNHPIEVYLPAVKEGGELVVYQLPAGQAVPLRTLGALPISYRSEIGTVRTTLLPSTVYRFHETSDSRLLLNEIDLAGDEETARGTGVASRDSLLKPVELPVKILVDEEEPAARELWEKRLRRRVAAASRVLEQVCLVQLKVVEVDTWKSNNQTQDFNEAFQEFTQQVNPSPARLAIGFTSQFAVPKEPGQVGLSSGLLRGHILLRESSSQATEVELVEALLHELGHVLGAVDQKIGNSLMRPNLIDGQARSANFPLQYDPVNLLLINLMGEEIRLRGVNTLAELSPGTRARLIQIYTKLGLAPKPQRDEEQTKEKVPASAVASDSDKPTSTPSSPKSADNKRTTPHPDLALFQGKWKVISAVRRGKAVPEALRYIPTLLDDGVTLEAKGLGKFRFRMDIDPDNETAELPKSAPVPFDLVMRVQDKDYVSHGIYQFDGYELKVCCARPGKPRPAKFASPENVDQALIVFRRDTGSK